MSAFSDRDFLSSILRERLFSIEPLNLENLQPGSIDLTLHETLFELTGSEPITADTCKEQLKECSHEVHIPDEGYALKPGQILIGYSSEEITLSTFVSGILCNRNSLSSLGLDATMSAYICPGFKGRKSLVIRNCGSFPIILKSHMPICQLIIFKLNSPALRSCKNIHNTDILHEHASKEITNAKYETKRSKHGEGLTDFFNYRLAEISMNNI